MSAFFTFRAAILAHLILVLPASSAFSSTSTIACEAEPTELHPAWVPAADSLETNLWSHEPVPILEWSHKLGQDSAVLQDPDMENDVRGSSNLIGRQGKTDERRALKWL